MSVDLRTRDGRPVLTWALLEAHDPSSRRAGAHTYFKCPVHESDHQRSFHVHNGTGQYKCHACGVTGTLREFWQGKKGISTDNSFEARGRALRAAQPLIADRKRDDFAKPLSAQAQAFLERMPAFVTLLADPQCPGALYLQQRGLDPMIAVRMGVGYCPAGQWPQDGARKVGRLVYPLADPYSGRLISALGRLALDKDASWSAPIAAAYSAAKQRKLLGCTAGVWPYTQLEHARATHAPLLLVEGPANVLALLQQTDTLPVVAQCGTAFSVPTGALIGIERLVIAFDNDANLAGKKGAALLFATYSDAKVDCYLPPSDWLGAYKDLGDAAQAHDDAACAFALAALQASGGYSDDNASQYIAALFTRIQALVLRLQPDQYAVSWDEMDAACAARDWSRLLRACSAVERHLTAQTENV